MKTLKEYLMALSIKNLMNFGLDREEAESFTVDLHRYGLIAFEQLPAHAQYAICDAFTWIFRPKTKTK